MEFSKLPIRPRHNQVIFNLLWRGFYVNLKSHNNEHFTWSDSRIVCGKSFPDVSGNAVAKIPAKMVGTPSTIIGNGVQNLARPPTNGTQREKILEIMELIPTA